MNFSTRDETALSEPDPPMEFRRRMRAWRKLLAHSGQKPGRKNVHRLRVATLRLQAALEFSLSSMDADSSSAGPMERWVRQAIKLRHALGPVRQADVSLDKLADLRSRAANPASAPAVFPKEHLDAIEKIERAVTSRRDAAAKKLVARIEKRRKRLKRLSRKLETSPGGFVSKLGNEAAPGIQLQIAAAAAEFPALEPGNLHQFRKCVKKIRYLAEMFAPLDPAVAHQAGLLKRMTGAIGEWHDWQALAEEAARESRGNTDVDATAEFLRAEASRSFENARAICTSTMARLLKGAEDGRGGSPASAQAPRKPVASVAPDPGAFHAERPRHGSNCAG